MDEQLKHRIVGVAVIVALLAIFAPLLFKNSALTGNKKMHSQYLAPPPPAKPQMAEAPLIPAQPAVKKTNTFKAAKVAKVDLDRTSRKVNNSKIIAAPAVKPALVKVRQQEDQQHRALILGKTSPATEITSNKKAVVIIEQPKKIALKTKDKVKLTKKKPVVASKTKTLKITAIKPVKKKVTAKKIATKTAAKGKNWVIQLGAFGEKANAVKLEKRVRAKGFHSYTRTQKSTAGKSITRVYVGPEAQRVRADQLRWRIQKLVRVKGVVVREHG